MKKILACLTILLLLSGSEFLKPDFNLDFHIETYKCDMSHYKGLPSIGHQFVGTTVSELKKTIYGKGYGAFVLSRKGCEHCQASMQYLNKAAFDLGLTIYYIDAESSAYPIVDTDDYDLLDRLLKPIEEKLDGEVTLQTPHFFTIIRGQFIDSFVGVDFKDTDNPTPNEIKQLTNKYKSALLRFVK